MSRTSFICAVAAGLTASAASAQVVINEVFENPPGSGSVDQVWEYIELYGKPGLDLTGYAIALLKGGADPDGDGVPGPLPAGFDPGEQVPEIDEAFSLDGHSLGANGLFVLYNANSAGFSQVLFQIPAETPRASFADTHIPFGDTVGRLANDGSSTYVLIRRRPAHDIDPETGLSVYMPGYAWHKDTAHDVNFDGAVDCGTETWVGVQGSFPFPIPTASSFLEPYQLVDEVSWSHRSGKEYQRFRDNKISDTPGFNPDAVSRVDYIVGRPDRGHRFNDAGTEVVTTRGADESWIYGNISSVTAASPLFLRYDNSIDSDGLIQSKGPTDPNGPTYDGSCNPDDPNVVCNPVPGAPFLFQDINLTGFRVTPGAMNDVDSTSVGGIVIEQFRFVEGDFNFDGVADLEDFKLIRSMVGRSLDETEPMLCDDGVTMIDAYVFQGAAFQSLLAMICMDESDGDATTVTQADVDAHRVLLGFGVAPDQNGDGVINSADLAIMLGFWGSDNPIADVTNSGAVGAGDLGALLGAWGVLP